MSLAHEFIDLEAETPEIFYIFGHSYELGEDENNWKLLEEFFEFISKRDDIFYGTNREVLLWEMRFCAEEKRMDNLALGQMIRKKFGK